MTTRFRTPESGRAEAHRDLTALADPGMVPGAPPLALIREKGKTMEEQQAAKRESIALQILRVELQRQKNDLKDSEEKIRHAEVDQLHQTLRIQELETAIEAIANIPPTDAANKQLLEISHPLLKQTYCYITDVRMDGGMAGNTSIEFNELLRINEILQEHEAGKMTAPAALLHIGQAIIRVLKPTKTKETQNAEQDAPAGRLE